MGVNFTWLQAPRISFRAPAVPVLPFSSLRLVRRPAPFLLFFFNETTTTDIYTSIDTLSLHDALPISIVRSRSPPFQASRCTSYKGCGRPRRSEEHTSELQSPIDISYAVFCLKKK